MKLIDTSVYVDDIEAELGPGFVLDVGTEPDPLPALIPELPRESDPRPKKTKSGKVAIWDPRHPGFTGTLGDYEKTFIVVEEQVRREKPDWPQGQIRHEAEKRYRALCEVKHPELPREYAHLMQSSYSPPRRDIRDSLEARACRMVPEMGELEELLSGCRRGRQSKRRLALACFERLALTPGLPELRSTLKAFQGSDLELDWAFFDTPDMEVNTAHMREESVVRKTMKKMLERHDPLIVQRLNLEVLRRIAERGEGRDIGRYLVIDGTEISAHVEQTVFVNDEHAERVLKDSGAALAFHGGGTGKRKRKPKSWVGWKLIVISDMKSGLPLVWMLVKGSEPEYKYVTELLERLFELAPWIDPQYLVGDSEFSRTKRLALDLQQVFGIIPVFDLRDQVAKDLPWSETKGVPHCSKHGAMKLVQAENFIPEEPVPVPFVYEPDEKKAGAKYDGRIRWRCEDCRAAGDKVGATTWARKDPRVYTYLPRGGSHRRAATRRALMLRRNSVEGLFSQLKRRGIGNRAHWRARWASKAVHMEWLTSVALFGMTLRREVHETDLYADTANEAWARNLTKVRPKVPKKVAA